MARWFIVLIVALLTLNTSCGSRGVQSTAAPAASTAPAGSSLALPRDGVQPWEKTDSRGYVIPSGAGLRTSQQSAGLKTRATSSFSPSALFNAGADRFLESSDVADNGEASTLTAPAGGLSYAIYRFTMGGQEPSAIAVDANLQTVGGKSSQYWVGISNYADQTWQWHGPYSEPQITLATDLSQDYLSALGNTFVAIAAYDGVALDVVGVTVSPYDTTDHTAPPAPAAPTATPVNGGLELSWTDVIAADLAGYLVYWSYSPFSAATDSGVQSVPWLENTTRMVLPVTQTRDVYVALSAVDVNGNDSALSPTARARRLIGQVGQVALSVSAPSALRNDGVTLTFSGADQYDVDTDGDGTFDITGDISGTATINTSTTGIIRPRVRGTSSDGTAVAFGSVSLIVSGNQRPVASAVATPSYGYAPLSVQLSGSGTDDDGSIAEYAWDVNGDGVYDTTSATTADFTKSYNKAGLYNAKLRVTDDQGAWDVDTVAVQVLGSDVTLTATPSAVDTGDPINLSLTVPSGTTGIEWDLDGDGTFETSTGTTSTASTHFTTAGRYTLSARGTYQGSVITGAANVVVHGWTHVYTETGPDMEGDTLSSLVISGHPALAYFTDGAFDLHYQRAGDSEGKVWNTPKLVDPNGGAWSSLKIVDGNPAMSYVSSPDGHLRYVRALDIAGNTWGTPVTIDTTGSSIGGAYTSMVVLQTSPPVPAIAFCPEGIGDLRFVRASDKDGTGWGTPTVLDAAAGSGFNASMLVVQGNPAIAHVSGNNIYYVRASDPGGATWGTPVLVLGGSSSPSYMNMVDLNGFPALAYQYYDGTNTYEDFQSASDVLGATWNSAFVLGPVAYGFQTLGVAGGAPFLIKSNGQVLQFARGNDAQGTSWTSLATFFNQNLITAPSLLEVQGSPAFFAPTYNAASSSYDVTFFRKY